MTAIEFELSRRAVVGAGLGVALAAGAPSLLQAAAPSKALGKRAPERMDELFGAWDKPRTPGVSFMVIEGGEMVLHRSYGRADIVHDIPWRLDMRHRIASISKQFAGALGLKLHHKGVVSLDQSIDRWLPELNPHAANITLRHLLSHQCGLKVDEPLMEFAGVPASSPNTLGGLYWMVAGQPRLNFRPGSYYEYNDAGSRAATLLMERASGMPLSELSEQELFAPLGMSQTGFVQKWTEVIPDSSATYRADGDVWTHEQYLLESSGDGGVVSSLPDLARWWEQFRTNGLGIPDFTEQMTQPVPLPRNRQSFYSLGWNIGEHRGLRFVQHTGSINAVMMMLPEVDVAIIAKANRYDFQRGTDAFRIFDALYPDFRGDGAPYAPLAYAARPASVARRYVHPETGVFVDVEQRGDVLSASLIGEEHMMRRIGNAWRAEAGSLTSLSLSPAGDSYDADLGDPAPKRLVPATDLPLTAARLRRWEGTYYSDDLRSAITIEQGEDEGQLTVGVGVNEGYVRSLTQTSDRSLAAQGMALAATDWDSSGRATGLVVSIPRVRQVNFRKI